MACSFARPRYSAAMRILLFIATGLALITPASSQDREAPYWASIRASKVNMRVGPSAEYKIDWVFQRQGLPVKVIRLREGWPLVQDPDGAQGWVVARLLSPDRSALVIGQEPAEMRSQPGGGARKWSLEPGVVGALGDCDEGWCELNVDGHEGWVAETRLWGVGEP